MEVQQNSPLRAEAVSKDEISELLQGDPAEVLKALMKDPFLAGLYLKQAVREGYSVGEHSYSQLQQLQKYYPEGFPGLSREASILLVCFHDIGKRVSNDTNEQHLHTPKIFGQYRHLLPITDTEAERIHALISRDPIGKYIRAVTRGGPTATLKMTLALDYHDGLIGPNSLQQLSEKLTIADPTAVATAADDCAKYLRNKASELKMGPKEFAALQIAFYKIDASCYTFDAARDAAGHFPNAELGLSISPPLTRFAEEKGTAQAEVRRLTTVYKTLERCDRLPRAYPSLDWLFEIKPDFDPLRDPATSEIFARDGVNGGMAFNPLLKVPIQELLTRVARTN